MSIFARPNLFKPGPITLASGSVSDFKIECDALTDDDWATLAKITAQIMPPYIWAYGVPNGGSLFAYHLNKSETLDLQGSTILIVDDVWTTGRSMIDYATNTDVFSSSRFDYEYVVAFSRGPTPDWVTPIFQLHEDLWEI